MELQSLCLGYHFPSLNFCNRRCFSFQSNLKASPNYIALGNRNVRVEDAPNYNFYRLWRLDAGIIVCASGFDPNSSLKHTGGESSGVPISRFGGVEPFRGNSGSVSFRGLTHQLVEESKLMSAPFQEGKGSLLWVLAPVALISSLILPQFFFSNAIEVFFKEESLVEIVSSLSYEVMFYIGLGTFLSVTDHVQRPYLQFSTKRWGLITGLRGYLASAFFTMGLKVIAPLFAVYVTWPVLGFPALVAVAPFLVGCAAQFAFETILDKRQSSCWPLVPIIFEVYRLYQLTRAAQFIQNFMFLMKDSARTAATAERGSALIGMVVTFQFLALLCLWSLVTFLLRLFPSRPVAENY